MESNLYTFSSDNAIKTALTFIVTVIVLSYLTSIIFNKIDSNSNIGYSISENKAINNNYKELYIGDSRTHQGVDTRILNNSYNLGRPGMQTPFTYFTMQEYLNNNNPPESLTVQFSFYLLGGIQWMKDIYFAYYKPSLWMVIDALSTQLVDMNQAIKWYFSPRFSLLRHKKRASDFLRIISKGHRKALSNAVSVSQNRRLLLQESNYGYLPRGSGSITDNDLKQAHYRVGIEKGYSNYFKYMKKLFNLALEYDFDIYVYSFPWPKKQLDLDPELPKIIEYYNNLIKKEANDNEKVFFIKYDNFWEQEYFVDPLHLNQKGAEKLTNILLKSKR
jgi:hypothetical protein